MSERYADIADVMERDYVLRHRAPHHMGDGSEFGDYARLTPQAVAEFEREETGMGHHGSEYRSDEEIRASAAHVPTNSILQADGVVGIGDQGVLDEMARKHWGTGTAAPGTYPSGPTRIGTGAIRVEPLLTDPIHRPAHYVGGAIEPIDVIEGFGLGYALGNCLKYILRAGKKGDRVEDLKKARQYLTREINAAEGKRSWEP